ncbi:hypothetical protein, variant [Puccinia triticina 1-1 BBBD Race 1]|uniref:Uncharacterized protein n=1 Tax=Puccinia triticina (isolate 1-1 / race 1 (BBBD)) TaxID=630390 RepID=A0A180GG96_PUCT1|nr:hypothetical protein, variant [Puccinia triticina 1-1 BBBD Race 1]
MDPLAATPASPDTKKGDKSSTTDDDPPEEIARKRAEIASGSAGLKAAPGGPMAVQPSVGPPSVPKIDPNLANAQKKKDLYQTSQAEADPVVADNRSNTHFNKSLPGPIGDPSGLRPPNRATCRGRSATTVSRSGMVMPLLLLDHTLSKVQLELFISAISLAIIGLIKNM